MKFEQILITPEAASELLEKHNGHNRPLSPSVVNTYARQMGEGLWKTNTAEPIKISTDGKLMDGQHRLAALVAYKKPLFFTVASGLEFEDVFTVLDTGKKRNASDALTISGIKNASVKAAGITNYLVLMAGRTIRDGNAYSRVSLGLSNADILNEYNKNPEFWDMMAERSISNYFLSNKVITTSFIMAWAARLDAIDSEKARVFMYKLCSGENLSANDAIFQLRNILTKAKLSVTRTLDSKYKAALLIKAWNKFYKGVTVKSLTYNPKVEKYPVLLGDTLATVESDN